MAPRAKSGKQEAQPSTAVMGRALAVQAFDDAYQAFRREWSDPQTDTLTDRLSRPLGRLSRARDELVLAQARVIGEETCPHCGGEGMAYAWDGDDWEGRRWERCPSCGGSGRA